MAHVNCPNCGKRLRFSDTSDPARIQCPICKHTFRATAGSALTSQTSPASQNPAASDYSEANLGWVAKASIIVMALAGIALLAFLVYKVANTGRPDQKQNPPQEIVRAVKTEKNKPTPTTMVAKPSPQLPRVTSKPAATPQVVKTGDNAPTPTTMITPPVAKLPQVTSKPVVMSPEELFAKASPAVVYVVVRDRNFKVISFGSGFFISADGLLVTNYHVIEKAEFATVLLSNNATLFVDGVAAVDAKADLALLKVNGKNLPHLTVSKEKPPKVGAKVYAIGNPQGLTNTLSEGMVSGLRKFKEGLTIQTTAPVSKGSSGGPLLTLNGKVIGVTTFYFRKGQNLNFAVPAAQVHRLIRKRGKLRTLASAGGKPLDKRATAELSKAWAAMDRKDWRTAAQILTRLRKTHKDSPFVWVTLGYLHGELGNHSVAIDSYRKAIAIKPDFAEAYWFMGSAYDELKRYTEAIAAYKKVITIKPDDASAYFFMGSAYDDLKRYPEAIAAYKKAIAIKPVYADAYLFMGIAYEELNRPVQAIAAYKKVIAIKPDDTDAYIFMGSAYNKLKRFPEAIAAYKKALAINPKEAELYLFLGFVYNKLKRYPEAIAISKKAIAINPKEAELYLFLGFVYNKLKRYPEAIAAYKKALAIKPDCGDAWLLMGETYDKSQCHKEAIAAYKKAVAFYKKAIAADPRDADAYCNMGWAYVLMQQYSEALAACKKTIALDADCAAAYCNMGHAYRGLRRHTEAIAAYKKALSLKPDADEAEIYYGMGRCYESLERYADAVAVYDKAIAIDPKGEFGRKAKTCRASALRRLKAK